MDKQLDAHDATEPVEQPAGVVVTRELAEKADRYEKALILIKHEVEHKKGGPERDDCVSVPYLYRIVKAALNEPVADARRKAGG